MANNKKNMDISSDRFDELLVIAGYTYPRTDKELELFESVYEDYDTELKGIRINPVEIINNSFKKKGKVVKFQDEDEHKDINEIRFAARNGIEEIPQSILDKMKSKHKDGDK